LKIAIRDTFEEFGRNRNCMNRFLKEEEKPVSVVEKSHVDVK
jgi:hypothetical protein